MRPATVVLWCVLSGCGLLAPLRAEAQPPPAPDGQHAAALSWLAQQQALNGGEWWGSTAATHVVRARPSVEATAEAILALAGSDSGGAEVRRGTAWLAGQPARSADVAARRVVALAAAGQPVQALRSQLLALRRANGSWGTRLAWEGDVYETVSCLQAVAGSGDSDLAGLRKAVEFVVGRQVISPSGGGGWGLDVQEAGCTADACTHVRETAQAVLALLRYERTLGIATSVDQGLLWLQARQDDAAGWFGEEGQPDVADTALAYLALVESRRDVGDDAVEAMAWLLEQQTWNPGTPGHGSWSGDVVATALAARALARHRPNLMVEQAGFTVSLASPSRQGHVVTLVATVRNRGTLASVGCEARFFAGPPGAGPPLGAPQPVPVLEPGAQAEVTVDWDTSEAVGTHELHVQVDVNGSNAPETDSNDNVRSRAHEILARPNLAVEDLHFEPAAPRAGEAFAAVFTLHNTGGYAIAGAGGVLTQTDPPAPPALTPTWTLQPGESRRVTFNLTRPSAVYSFRAEAVSPTVEEDTTDNVATADVAVGDATDVAILPSGIGVSDEDAEQGDLLALTATVSNRGTTSVTGVVVEFFDGNPSAGDPIGLPQTLAGPIPPGGTATATVSWNTSGLSGSRAVTVVVDRGNLLSESNENNNRAARMVHLNDRPDLAATYTSYRVHGAGGGVNVPITEGADVDFTCSITPGTLNLLPSVSVAFYDGDPDDGGVPFGFDSVSLRDGLPQDATSPRWTTTGHAGGHSIWCVADPAGVVVETSETNNRASHDIVVAPFVKPNLHVSRLDIASSVPEPVDGETITLSARVENFGAAAVTTSTVTFDEVLDSGDVVLVSTHALALDARSEVVVVSGPWDTTGRSGEHRFRVTITGATPTESTTQDNLAEAWVRVHVPPADASVTLVSASPAAGGAPPVTLEWTTAGTLDGVLVYRDGACLDCVERVTVGPGTTVSANTDEVNAGKVRDGLKNSEWNAGGVTTAAGKFVRIDLAAPRVVDRVTVRWRSTTLIPGTFTVELLDELGAPVDTRIISDHATLDLEVPFSNGVTAHAVRLVVNTPRPSGTNRFGEIDAWAVGSLATSPFLDADARTNARHDYRVQGVRVVNGRRTIRSNSLNVALGDTTPPAEPAIPGPPPNPAPGAAGGTENDRLLTWSGVGDPDVKGYRLYRTGLNVAAASRGAVAYLMGGDDLASLETLLPDACRLIDGQNNATNVARSYWQQAVPMMPAVMLAREYAIDRLVVHLPRDGQLYSYFIQSSLDGRAWTRIPGAEATRVAGDTREHLIPVTSARYLRIWPVLSTGVVGVAGAPLATEFRVAELEAFSRDLAPLVGNVVTTVAQHHSTYTANDTDGSTWSNTPASPGSGLHSFAFPVVELWSDRASLEVTRIHGGGGVLARVAGGAGPLVTQAARFTGSPTPTVSAAFVSDALARNFVRWEGRSELALAPAAATSHLDTLLRDGSIQYGVAAVDVEGNESTRAVSDVEAFTDTLAPRAPDQVTCGLSGADPIVTWGYVGTTPTDLAGFKVYRRLETGTDADYEWVSGPWLVAFPGTLAYVDREAASEVVHRWKVSALDHEGHETPAPDSNARWCSGHPLGIDLVASNPGIFTFPSRPSAGHGGRLAAVVTNVGDGQLVLNEGDEDPMLNVAHGITVTFADGTGWSGTATVADLAQSHSALASVPWTPAAAGEPTITVTIACTDTELSTANNSASRVVEVAAEPPLVLTTGVPDPSAFPSIAIPVAVGDANGDGVFGLDEGNFGVDEDTLPARDVVVEALNAPAQPGDAPRQVDVLFLGDSSNSMREEWALVARAKPVIEDLLAAAGLDAHATLHQIGRKAGNHAPTIPPGTNIIKHGHLNGQVITSTSTDNQGDPEWEMNDHWGPPTAWVASESSLWRPGARRFIVLFGDQGPLGPGRRMDELEALQELIDTCADHETTILALLGNGAGADYNAFMAMLTSAAEETGGGARPADDAFGIASFVLDHASSETARYRLTFTTPNPARDGSVRSVGLTATQATRVGSRATTYRAPLVMLPDVVVEAVSLPPGAIIAGDVVEVQARVANRGGAPARGVEVALQDGDPAVDGRTEAVSVLAGLAPGEVIGVTLAWRALAGERVLRVEADPLNTIVENDEANNVALASVAVTGEHLPELAVDVRAVVLTPTRPREGDRQEIRVTVVNRGLSGATDVVLHAYDGDPDAGATTVAEATVAWIGPGSSIQQTLEWTVTSPSGRRWLPVVVDPADGIREGREDDNRADVLLDVAGSGLFARLAWPGGAVEHDTNVAWSWRVENAGEAPFRGTARLELLDADREQALVVSEVQVMLGAVAAPWRTQAREFEVTPAEDLRAIAVEALVSFPATIGGAPFAPESVTVVETDQAGRTIARLPARFLPHQAGGSTGLLEWYVAGEWDAAVTRHFRALHAGASSAPFDEAAGPRTLEDRSALFVTSEIGDVYRLNLDAAGRIHDATVLGDPTPSLRVHAPKDDDLVALPADFDADGTGDLFLGGLNTIENAMGLTPDVSANLMEVRWSGGEGLESDVLRLVTNHAVRQVVFAAVGDLDADGLPDLVVDYRTHEPEHGTSTGRRYLAAWMNEGGRSFTRHDLSTAIRGGANVATNGDDFAFTVGDLDGDGDADIVQSRKDLLGHVKVFRNDGVPSFTQVAQLATAAEFSSVPLGVQVAIGDVNGDGHADLVGFVKTSSSLAAHARVWLGHGDFTFGSGVGIETWPWKEGTVNQVELARPVLLDLDGDGRLDLLGAGNEPDTDGNNKVSSLALLAGVGDGSFLRATHLWARATPLQHVAATARMRLVATPVGGDLALTDASQAHVGEWQAGTLPEGDYRARLVFVAEDGREVTPEPSFHEAALGPTSDPEAVLTDADRTTVPGLVRLERASLENVALGRPASTTGAGTGPQLAVDGITSGGGFTNKWLLPGAAGWLQVDFEHVRYVDQVEAWNWFTEDYSITGTTEDRWQSDEQFVAAGRFLGTLSQGNRLIFHEVGIPVAARRVRFFAEGSDDRTGLQELALRESTFVPAATVELPIADGLGTAPSAPGVAAEALTLDAAIPLSTSVALEARAGDVADASTWDPEWTAVHPGFPLPSGLRKRYLSVRAALGTANPHLTPGVRDVSVTWRDSGEHPFHVNGDVSLQASVATNRHSYRAREVVSLTAGITSLSHSHVFDSLHLACEIRDAGGTVAVASPASGIDVTALGPGARRTRQFTWSSGTTPPGTYHAHLTVSDGALVLAAIDSLDFVIESDPLGNLTGTLTARPLIIDAITTYTVDWSVRNAGNEALGTAQAVIRARHEASGTADWSPDAVVEDLSGLVVDGSRSGTISRTSAGHRSGAHRVTLEVEVGGARRALASAGFTVRDVTPPVIAAVTSPLPDGLPYWDATLDVVATITDAESGVANASFRVSGMAPDAWIPLVRQGTSDTWSRLGFDVSGLAEGEHVVSIRAADDAGNHWDTVATDANPVNVERVWFDHAPPEIRVTWMPDGAGPGECTNTQFRLTWVAWDSVGVDLGQLTHNSRSVAPGPPETEVGTDPHHVLDGVVRDHAGHEATYHREWDYDAAVPVPTLALGTEVAGTPPYPRNGRYFNVPVRVAVSFADAHAVLNEQVAVSRDGAWEGPTWLDPATVLIDLAPAAEEGEFRIRGRADDSCGNVGTDWTYGSSGGAVNDPFVIDKRAPDILVTGVMAGTRYFQPLQPVVTVTDNVGLDAPATVTLWRDLNHDGTFGSGEGAPYAGAPITASDHYRLDVLARDLAGNEASFQAHFELHVIARTLALDNAMARVLVVQPDASLPALHSQQALTEGGIDFDVASSTDQLIEKMRRGRANVVLLHRGNALGTPSAHPNWMTSWGSELQATVSLCPPGWLGLVDVGAVDIVGRPLQDILGAHRSTTLPATGTIGFVNSAITPPASIPFTGLGQAAIFTTSDPHAAIDIVPAGTMSEVTAAFGRAVMYSTDYESDRRAEWKPIIRGSVKYTVPQVVRDLAANMVVAVSSTIVNQGPAITLRLQDVWAPTRPAPDEAKLEKAIGSPVSTNPIAYVVTLPAWDGVSPPPSVTLSYLERLPDVAVPSAARFDSVVTVSGGAEVVDADATDLLVLENRVTARSALDAALASLDALLTNPSDRARLATARSWLNLRTGDPTKNDADLKTIDLVKAYEELVQITTADTGPACRELTRLLLYWGWEYTTRP